MTRTIAPSPTFGQTLTGKYLTFHVGQEQFGISLPRVREIMSLIPTTRVPGESPEIRGVINLRGKIVAVMDLRRRFEMCEVECSDRACIIVTEVRDQDRHFDMGLLVDGIGEVLKVKENDLEPPPEFGMPVDSSFILGIAKATSGSKMLLDVDQVACH